MLQSVIACGELMQMKVIIVDDERIALEHVKSLIPWERHGYEIAATATNGRSALRLCEELRPELMIVDIRMPVMDGLELIRAVTERGFGVKFILMSAYEDFEYARQAIALGSVSGYLIKHELDGAKLLVELDKAREAWQADERKRNAERAGRLKEAVLNGRLADVPGGQAGGPPYGLLLVQADKPFASIPSAAVPVDFGSGGSPADIRPPAHGVWEWLGGFTLQADQLVLLFARKSRCAPPARDALHHIAASLQRQLADRYRADFSCFYTFHASDASRLPAALHRVAEAAGHGIFCGKNALACADELPLPDRMRHACAPGRGVRLNELLSGLQCSNSAIIENAINRLFDNLTRPHWDLPGLYEAVHILTRLYNDRRLSFGLAEEDPLRAGSAAPIYHINDIRRRFVQAFRDIAAADHGRRLSARLLRAMHYIREHYQEDLRIEDVAGATGISASYLHRLFKRELRCTFLDYLTDVRIQQAKLILLHEDAKMTEVSARVGYRSPQHFSRMFKRVTGMLPHQFREGRLT